MADSISLRFEREVGMVYVATHRIGQKNGRNRRQRTISLTHDVAVQGILRAP